MRNNSREIEVLVRASSRPDGFVPNFPVNCILAFCAACLPILLFGLGLMYFASLGEAMAASGDNWRIRTESAQIYEAPDRSASVALTLNYGNRLKELRREGPWIKVLVFDRIGAEGWVHESDIEPVRRQEDGSNVQDEVAADPRETPESALPPPRFVLSLSGTRQRYRANCKLVSSKGTRMEKRFTGSAPTNIALRASAVECRIDRLDQRAGTLFVKLFERGRTLPVGANSSSSAFGCVRVRSDGPWGRGYARRCSRVAIF